MGQHTRNRFQSRNNSPITEIGVGKRKQFKVAVEAEQAVATDPKSANVADYFGFEGKAPRQSGSEATRAGMLVDMLPDSSAVSAEQLMKVIQAHNANSGVSASALRSLRKRPVTTN